MKVRYLIALLVAVIFMAGTRIAHAEIKWTRSIKDAQQRAKAERKPVMIDTYTTWCGWCKKLDAETFKDARVGELSRSFVTLKIDAEAEGAGIAQQYEVTGFPTVLFLTPEGRVITRIPGYVDGPTMADVMEKVLGAHAKLEAQSKPASGATKNNAAVNKPVNQRALSKQQQQAMVQANKYPKKPAGLVLTEDKGSTLVADSDGVFMVVDAPPAKPKAKATTKKPVAKVQKNR